MLMSDMCGRQGETEQKSRKIITIDIIHAKLRLEVLPDFMRFYSAIYESFFALPQICISTPPHWV